MSISSAPPPVAPVADKLLPSHRDRRAYIYVRQSTFRQVVQNRASQQNQSALTERALALGWAPERIRVIDTDLGHSGRERDRPGFQELVAAVARGQVGIVLAYEASRLARNNADWYELLDLAARVGTLIGDTDGIYDPRSYNDRLLLGLRGMLSEAELHLLRLRLDAGRLRHVEQGTFRQLLPTGLVRLPSGQAVKDPDQQIQHTLALVFDGFQRLGSVSQLLRRLHADGIRLPRRQTGGPRAGEVVWQAPSVGALLAILHNPAYAGAFAYGRRTLSAESGPGQPRGAVRPMAAWTALHQGVYPAYISWETFVTNQERLANNRYRFVAQAQGAPRDGAALLTGLLQCGHCGRQLRVRYRPAVRYACTTRSRAQVVPACLLVPGASLEAVVVAAFFAALQPAELALLDESLAQAQAEQAQRVQYHADQVRRAEDEARLAEKQYRAVDPENRLVAAELERRWELALRALAAAREAAEAIARQPAAPTLSPSFKEQLRDLGRHLPAWWDQGQLEVVQKKELLRSLIRRVVVRRPTPGAVEATIVWVSGALTPLVIQPPLTRSADLPDYDRIVARVQELSELGYPDRTIARQLAADGRRSAHQRALPLSLVRTIRRATGAPSLTEALRGQARCEGAWTAGGLARLLGVRRESIYHRITAGRIPTTRHPTTGHYLIADDPALLARLRAESGANDPS